MPVNDEVSAAVTKPAQSTGTQWPHRVLQSKWLENTKQFLATEGK